ncbi:M15 family metallopeptidase [Roseateles terrae]|uniref:Peptidoglycan-binding protein n=1 Tax=Roseateles terrae TaxID=431060 RepID=A0ABR6GSH7_9BURK|nr:M15 family metallopeptidase [Roseateles terrae]MBB3195062.1 hypothetical protein [Roseateles terrae]
MQVHLTGAVGVAAANRQSDVVAIQRLLVTRRLYPGQIDGRCGPLTVNGILKFQSGFMGKPDGRVDPNGQTLRRLTASAASTASTASAGAARHPAASAATRPAAPAHAAASAARPAASTPVAAAAPAQPTVQQPAVVAQAAGTNTAASKALLSSYVAVPERHLMNPGLQAVSSSFMVQTLGNPRETYSQDCQPLTNQKLKRHIVVARSVGPFKVTGLDVAVESLQKVMDDIRVEQPLVYESLSTAGMLCCRNIRGSSRSISNHSWGTAIDLKLNNRLDVRGDNQVQMGLTLIAPIFNRHGWYWGAAFRTEDAMHFEAGKQLIQQWAPRLT